MTKPKTVFITGAAGGIGRATAIAFARKGWLVAATDIEEEPLQELSSYGKVIIRRMDVTSDKSVRETFLSLDKEVFRYDLMINNAGIDCYMPFSEATSKELSGIFEVNFFGAVRVSHEGIPRLNTPGGRMIFIGSESHHLTLPFMPYPLTKRLLESYAKALRIELKYRKIDVVIVRPGAVRTRFIDDLSSISYQVSDPMLKRAFTHFTSSVPEEVGHTISPEKVAALILEIAGIHRPKAVYRINNSLRLRIASIIPFRFMEMAVIRKLGGMKD